MEDQKNRSGRVGSNACPPFQKSRTKPPGHLDDPEVRRFISHIYSIKLISWKNVQIPVTVDVTDLNTHIPSTFQRVRCSSGKPAPRAFVIAVSRKVSPFFDMGGENTSLFNWLSRSDAFDRASDVLLGLWNRRLLMGSAVCRGACDIAPIESVLKKFELFENITVF